MLKDEAKHWSRATRETLLLDEDKPLIWGVFLKVFHNYYFPRSVHDAKERGFFELVQGNMMVLL